MISKAQKEADKRYKAKNTKQVIVRFYPAEEELYKHLQAQENKAGYIKELIRKDLGTK